MAFRFYLWLAHRTQGHDPRDPWGNDPPIMSDWLSMRYRLWAFAMHGLVRISNRRYARKMKRRIASLVLTQDARDLTRQIT